MRHQNRETRRAETLALGLGWFSIGLGLAELAAPRSVARLIGLPETDRHTTTLQALGAREIAHGVAILSQPDSAARVWTRVGGDALDLSVLCAALGEETTDRTRLAAAMAAVLGVSILDVIAAQGLGRQERHGGRSGRRGVRVERVTTINKPVHEVYQFWRNFENLPRFMRHLESVEVLDERRSRWRAKAPAGLHVEWEAELLQDRNGEWIAWRSVEGSGIRNSGSVRFQPAPGARGTELRVQLQYDPPAGSVGRLIASLFGEEPDQQIHEDLHRFKQLMETGEIPLSDGPSMWRPARPAQNPDEIKALAGVHP